ncbi:MAG: hypothetical protein DCC58_04500 [Chloroflexi bacterium]|nr:MAG: hypothetical protein DCC58_04500 [Chloroflexota bacterium]
MRHRVHSTVAQAIVREGLAAISEQIQATTPDTSSTLSRLAPYLWAVGGLGLLAVFVLRERGEVTNTVAALRTAAPVWLIVAILGGVGAKVAMTLAYRTTLNRMGHTVGFWPVQVALLQRDVVATIVPIGGPAGMYAFSRTLDRSGVRTADAVYIYVLNGILGYLSFALFLVPVLGLAAFTGGMSRTVSLAAGLFAVSVVVLVAGVIAVQRGMGESGRIAARLPQRVLRVIEYVRSQDIQPRYLAYALLLHLTVELCGVAMVYGSLQAVHANLSVLQACVGYAVGSLFMLISPVLQGLGVVELTMTVALTRFGAPSGVALGAVLLYRAVEIWLPFAVGVSVQAARPEVRRHAVHLPAVLAGVVGVLSVLSVVAPRIEQRFNHMHAYAFRAPEDFSRHLTLIAGFFLIFLSYSLWRRKYVAWVAALALLVITTLTHLTKRHDQIVAIVAAVNIILLVMQRERFRVRSDLPTIRQGVVRFIVSLGVAVVYGTLGFFLIDQRAFGVEFNLIGAVEETTRRFLGLNATNLEAQTRYARWFLDSLTLIGIVSLCYAVFSLARPVVWRRYTLPAERNRARALIEQYGDSSLDFFKYYPDKYFFFSSTDRGVVSYGVALYTAVALGDPVATDDVECERVTREFLDFCDANDWNVAFHQVPAKRLPLYTRLGLRTLKIGEDAVVDLTTFSTQGGAWKSIRSSINRLEREGYRAVFTAPPQSDARLEQLRATSNAWLGIHGRRERGFTLGQFHDDYIRHSPIMAIEDAAGDVVAFANLIPCGGPGLTSIDLMRRREKPSGSMDMLFIKLFEYAKSAGFTRFSLGMAPFSEVGNAPGASATERAIHLLYEHFNRFFSYKGLHEYKAKFHPIWEPMYLVYESELTLPVVALAIVRITEADDATTMDPGDVEFIAEAESDDAADELQESKA